MRISKVLVILVIIAANKLTFTHAGTPSNPNIILILADDMGWSDIGSYGGEIATPHLDSLAGGGMRFTQFHNTSKCFPSRATLMTGLYAQQVGMDKNVASLRNATTLAQVLRGQGYRTLMVGKHHGTDNPFDLGFDHYSGLKDGATNHFNPGHPRKGEPAPAQKRPGKRHWCFDAKCLQPYTPKEKDFYSTDYYTKWALEYLDNYKNEDKPYFLYVSYQAPHDPLQAWPEDIAKYKNAYKGGYSAVAKARYQRLRDLKLIDGSYSFPEPTHRVWDSLSAAEKEDQQLRMAVYAAMIDRMDQNIGKLLAKVKAMGEEDNTLILFASDNGSSAEVVDVGEGEIGSATRWASLGKDWANVSNTPFRLYKNNSHQGGITTPLIAYWPDGIKQQGAITAYPGHFIDIMATLVDITGARYPSVTSGGDKISLYEGQSLLPVFKDKAITVRDKPLFWQWNKGKAVRLGDWKLVSKGSEPASNRPVWELYNMASDKSETNNLVKQQSDVVNIMSALFDQWLLRVTAK